MDEPATIELLQRTHTFPGVYVFKVIGRAEGAFAERVVAAAREALGRTDDPPFRVRAASGGRHVAVTLEPQVTTPQQILAVYRRLRTTAGLVMFL